MPPIVLLMAQVVLGAAVYWVISVVTKNESYKTALGFARQIMKKGAKKG